MPVCFQARWPLVLLLLTFVLMISSLAVSTAAFESSSAPGAFKDDLCAAAGNTSFKTGPAVNADEEVAKATSGINADDAVAMAASAIKAAAGSFKAAVISLWVQVSALCRPSSGLGWMMICMACVAVLPARSQEHRKMQRDAAKEAICSLVGLLLAPMRLICAAAQLLLASVVGVFDNAEGLCGMFAKILAWLFGIIAPSRCNTKCSTSSISSLHHIHLQQQQPLQLR